MKLYTDNFVEKLLRYRFLVLIAVVTVSFFFGYFLITGLKIDNDPTRAIPDDIKAKKKFRKLNKIFPSRRAVLVLAKFTNENLLAKVSHITNWTAAFAAIDGVVETYNAANLAVPVKPRQSSFFGSFGIKSETIYKPGMSAERFRKRLATHHSFAKVFISDDEKVLSIAVRVANDKDKSRIAARMYDMAQRFSKKSKTDIYLTGAPMYSFYTNLYMKQDMKLLLPVALVVIFLLLYWIYRRILFVCASLFIIVVALVWTFGLMALLGISVSVVSSMVPVILFPIGVADSIHIIKTYILHREEGKIGLKISLQRTYRELTKPVILTTITTFIGFASFSFSNITWVKYFGLFTGIGT
ncbi:MAG TPA: MMPL family transporter, partial [Spirochaetota bacterium]|nr:MMPL family transporter [Spirochaetota bacterium]